MIAINNRPMNTLLSLFGIFNLTHIDKSETSGAAGSWISYQLDFINAPVLFKDSLQVPIICLEAQAENADDTAWAGIETSVVW